MKEKQAIFRYYWDPEKTKSELEILVEYISNTMIDIEEYKLRKNIFNNYLNNLKSNDIVGVTAKIKEMFEDFDEEKLSVSIKDGKYYQEVSYFKGQVDSCYFSTEYWDDIISISDDYRGTNIHYKKNHNHINSNEDIKTINNELNAFYQKIIQLHNLEKKHDLEKARKLVKE